MTKIMIALALLLAGVLTLGMSQHAVAAGPAASTPVELYEQGLDCLLGRNGTEVDPERAIANFRILAAQGWAIAQHALGEIYDEGLGVEADPARAYLWYRRAAEQGFPPAVERLAELRARPSPAELARAEARERGLQLAGQF